MAHVRTASSEAKRKTNVRFNRRGVVGHGFEKSSWSETGKVECDDGEGPGSPANLEISLRLFRSTAAMLATNEQHSYFVSVAQCSSFDEVLV
jgi:hypothetical protein